MNDSKDVVLPHMPIEFSAVIDAKLIAASDRQPIVRANPAHHVAVSRYPQATADDVLQCDHQRSAGGGHQDMELKILS